MADKAIGAVVCSVSLCHENFKRSDRDVLRQRVDVRVGDCNCGWQNRGAAEVLRFQGTLIM